MELMNALMSSCVGHDFWHGASAHLRQREASFRAPRSVRLVGFTSRKSFSRLHDC
jgi:hypothetical protein